MKLGMGERAAWGDFPDVARNGDLGTLKNEPEYMAAKGGDMAAALDMVDRLLTDETVQSIKTLVGDSDSPAKILPVLAVEESGNNKIPLAMAEVLSDRLGLDVELGILQCEKVGRTNTGADHRLAFNPTFEGEVIKGQKYLLVDDTLTMGGTVASLRGFVENRGGDVVGAAVMTAHVGALKLPVKPKMLAAIERKHGTDMDQYWQETFGYGIDKLTQGECGHLKAAQSVDEIRERISAARHEGVRALGEKRAEGAKTEASAQPVDAAQADKALVTAAEQLESNQASAIENASLEETYRKTLSVYTEKKHDQVERIEDRLEHLLDREQTKLQQCQASRPGALSTPGRRREWQATESRHRARLQTLTLRLDHVREIKDGMGLHAPRVEEMATRKMRSENPELASDWDTMRENERRNKLITRTEQQKKQTQSRDHGRSLSRRVPN